MGAEDRHQSKEQTTSQKIQKVHLELQSQRVTPLPEACSAGGGSRPDTRQREKEQNR